MTDERYVKKLQGRLRQLDEKRAVIQAKLKEVMLDHIEIERVETQTANMEGEAHLFALMTKARLMQIIEEHWRIHHMAAIGHYDGWSKEQLVNEVLLLKGLPGHYTKPAARGRAGTGQPRGKHSPLLV